MNSHMYYDDNIQIEETEAYRQYETEQEYWEEYDRIKALKEKSKIVSRRNIFS